MQDDFGNEIHPLTVHEIRKRLSDGAARMRRIEAELAVVTTAIESIKSDTSELLQVLDAMKGAFRVLDWLGRFARPLAAIVALAAALWGLVTTVKGGGLK